MISHAPAANAVLVALLAAAGFGFGELYFECLRRSTLRNGAVRAAPTLAVLALGRIIAAVAVFAAAAKLGAAPLLAALFGFLAARALTLRIVRRSG